MAYLRNYRWDVFVSYAHRPIEVANRDQAGMTWTKRVVDNLVRLIESELGEPVEFFLDIDSQETDRDMTTGLLDAVESAGLLLVFVSPEYLKSRWCGKEIGQYRSRSRWSQDDSKNGVFILEVQPTEGLKWPPELKDVEGNRNFWHALHSKPLGDPNALSLTIALFAGDGDEGLLYKKLGKVAGHLIGSLRSLKEQEQRAGESTGGARSVPQTPGSAEAQRVFLAYPADSNAWNSNEEIRALMKNQGFDVVEHSQREEFQSKEKFQGRIRQDLETSKIFVQVLSNQDDPWGMTEIQYLEAQQLQLPTFLWRPETLDASQVSKGFYPKYAAFAAEHFPEARTGSLAELVEAVEQHFREDSKPARPILKPTRPKPNVFVYSVDPKGYTFVKKELAPVLPEVIRKRGCRVRIPDETWTPKAIQDFRETLVEQCNALIVVHSAEEEEKVAAVIDELSLKFFSKHGDSKLLYIAILETPPGTLLEQPDEEFEVFDCMDMKVKSDLEEWLMALSDSFVS
jgi:hypothetical protein